MNNFTEIDFINKLFRNTVEENTKWKIMNDIPNILAYKNDILITSCYMSSLSNGNFLVLFKYRMPIYDGERDSFYHIESVNLVLLNSYKTQVLWENSQSSKLLDELYDVVSYKYSGINNIFESL